jgi:hypothetical protein
MNFRLRTIERCLRHIAELDEHAGTTGDHIARSRFERDMAKTTSVKIPPTSTPMSFIADRSFRVMSWPMVEFVIVRGDSVK